MKAIRRINLLNNHIRLNKGELNTFNKINFSLNKRFLHNNTRNELKNKSENVFLLIYYLFLYQNNNFDN